MLLRWYRLKIPRDSSQFYWDPMFHLTPQEKKVLIALGLIFLCGSTLDFVFKKNQRHDESGSVRFAHQVDVNHASFEELVRVPYIGEKTAQRLINYRKEHKAFTNLEQIKTIQGIYSKSYEKMKPYLKI